MTKGHLTKRSVTSPGGAFFFAPDGLLPMSIPPMTTVNLRAREAPHVWDINHLQIPSAMNARFLSLLGFAFVLSSASVQAQTLQAEMLRIDTAFDAPDTDRDTDRAQFGRTAGFDNGAANDATMRSTRTYYVKATVVNSGPFGMRTTQTTIKEKGFTKKHALTRLRDRVSQIAGARIVSLEFFSL